MANNAKARLCSIRSVCCEIMGNEVDILEYDWFLGVSRNFLSWIEMHWAEIKADLGQLITNYHIYRVNRVSVTKYITALYNSKVLAW